MSELIFFFWNVSEIEKGNPKYVISSNCAASSAPLLFATITNNLDLDSEKFNLEITLACIC